MHERADQRRHARRVGASLDVAEAPPARTLPEGGGARRAQPTRRDVVVTGLVDARIDDAAIGDARTLGDLVHLHEPQCDRRV